MPTSAAPVSLPQRAPISPIPAVNVATVPQRSPLRYPGGKTWLIPHIRVWLSSIDPAPELLIEPFAGGGTLSLTAVMEGLAARCAMAEIDREVAAFWQAALRHSDELIGRVAQFTPTYESIAELVGQLPSGMAGHGFRTLVLNRTRRGGILADGASLNRSGENGKGIASRWYPDTIIRRLKAVAEYADQIDFHEIDGMLLLERLLAGDAVSQVAVFADPPYTAGGKQAGRRLYNHNIIDHSRLFAILADSGVNFLATYDESPEIMEIIGRYRFHAMRVVMKNTHHAHRGELVITRRPLQIEGAL